jgi:hypothetical protein
LTKPKTKPFFLGGVFELSPRFNEKGNNELIPGRHQRKSGPPGSSCPPGLSVYPAQPGLSVYRFIGLSVCPFYFLSAVLYKLNYISPQSAIANNPRESGIRNLEPGTGTVSVYVTRSSTAREFGFGFGPRLARHAAAGC